MLAHFGLCSKNVLLVYYALVLDQELEQNFAAFTVGLQTKSLVTICYQCTVGISLLILGELRRNSTMKLMISRNSLGAGAISHPSYHHVQSNLTHLAGSCHQVPLS
jgi:hypothetical protein